MKRVITLLSIILSIVFGLAAYVSAETSNTNYRLTSTGLYKYPNGIIYDSKTNLEWYVGYRLAITWNLGKRWAESEKLDQGGWRLPTRFELGSLYSEGTGDYNIDPVFDFEFHEPSDLILIVSSETRGESEGCIYGFNNKYDFINRDAQFNNVFTLWVRTRK